MEFTVDTNFMVPTISTGSAVLMSAVSLILSVLMLVCNWRMFNKAGVPGWMSLIPIVNVFKLFEIARGSGWKMLFMFIPLFNFFYIIGTIHKLVKSFGYGLPMTILYFVASPVALIILAFGNNEYYGPY